MNDPVEAISFSHRPLTDSSRHIRLLRILPGDGELEVELFSGDVSNNVPTTAYAALSYACGPPSPRHLIYVNDKPFEIRENLYLFLMQIRIHSESHLLWIDALCINQTDKEEKSRQVLLMGEIYSKAHKVYAWLGEGDCESNVIFDVLQEFRKRKERDQPNTGLDAAEELSYYRELFRGIYEETAGGFPQESDLHDEMLHEEINWLRPLCSRPYWQRVWIVQEAVLAKSLVICCGEKSIDFEDIYGLSLDWGSFEQGFSTYNHRQLKHESNGWNTIQAICGHRRRKERTYLPESLTLMSDDVEMLQEVIEVYASNHLCENPRDKVYGLRALVPQWKGLVVDYEQSVLEVFLDTARCGLFNPAKGGGSYLAFGLFSAMGLGSRETFDKAFPCTT